jgi:hypothetical protein
MTVTFEVFGRVRHDVNKLMAALCKHSRGNAPARRHEIYAAMYEIAQAPASRPVRFRRRSTGVELRRWDIRQFTLIYSYDPPSRAAPHGIVCVRAVRHSRVGNVFGYVRETPAHPYGMICA